MFHPISKFFYFHFRKVGEADYARDNFRRLLVFASHAPTSAPTAMTERLLPKPRPITIRSLLFLGPGPRPKHADVNVHPRATYCGKRTCATGYQKAGALRRTRLLGCNVRRGARRVVGVGSER